MHCGTHRVIHTHTMALNAHIHATFTRTHLMSLKTHIMGPSNSCALILRPLTPIYIYATFMYIHCVALNTHMVGLWHACIQISWPSTPSTFMRTHCMETDTDSDTFTQALNTHHIHAYPLYGPFSRIYGTFEHTHFRLWKPTYTRYTPCHTYPFHGP